MKGRIVFFSLLSLAGLTLLQNEYGTLAYAYQKILYFREKSNVVKQVYYD